MVLDYAFIEQLYELLCNIALQIVGNICMIGCVLKAKNTRVRGVRKINKHDSSETDN